MSPATEHSIRIAVRHVATALLPHLHSIGESTASYVAGVMPELSQPGAFELARTACHASSKALLEALPPARQFLPPDRTKKRRGVESSEKWPGTDSSSRTAAVAGLLPSESAAIDVVSREIGVSVDTLERWRAQAMAQPTQQRAWTAAARFEAVRTTAAMDEATKNSGCREHGTAFTRRTWLP
jgi:hypothetical protein